MKNSLIVNTPSYRRTYHPIFSPSILFRFLWCYSSPVVFAFPDNIIQLPSSFLFFSCLNMQGFTLAFVILVLQLDSTLAHGFPLARSGYATDTPTCGPPKITTTIEPFAMIDCQTDAGTKKILMTLRHHKSVNGRDIFTSRAGNPGIPDPNEW